MSRPIVQKIILFAFYHNVCQIQFNDMLESKVFYMKITTRKMKNITGQIVTHQIRSIDYQHRNLQAVETCDILTWTDVLSIIQNFI